MNAFRDDDETEARLFNEILELPPETRKRLFEAVKLYELVMLNAEEVSPSQKGSFR